MDFCELTTDRIFLESVARRFVPPECGATVTLDGYVRQKTKSRETLYLSYEAYEPMALREMQKLIEAAKREFAISQVGIVHRLGRLEVGETSVVISVALTGLVTVAGTPLTRCGKKNIFLAALPALSVKPCGSPASSSIAPIPPFARNVTLNANESKNLLTFSDVKSRGVTTISTQKSCSKFATNLRMDVCEEMVKTSFAPCEFFSSAVAPRFLSSASLSCNNVRPN
ncbi:MAG: molybdenum cofactor biosynthesis protein MoaE [Acidobacteria bacterium]|nr:molybdenum cofactor biosynthesis protein MoaE [Acidobacteriota bacterium]